jgi:hypothetical protein
MEIAHSAAFFLVQYHDMTCKGLRCMLVGYIRTCDIAYRHAKKENACPAKWGEAKLEMWFQANANIHIRTLKQIPGLGHPMTSSPESPLLFPILPFLHTATLLLPIQQSNAMCVGKSRAWATGVVTLP